MRVLLTILMLVGVAYGQSTYYIRYDTVKIGKGAGGPGELVVESSTKDTLNGVLLNYSGGRTRFQRIRAISATQFTVGTDTITITGSGGGGGSSAWGSITGTLSSQTDLQTALNAKAALVHTHVISDVTSLQSTIDAKVADAINDGTTTIAPSQNAVFDALALKAATVHTHVIGDVTNLQSTLNNAGKNPQWLITNGIGAATKFVSMGLNRSQVTTSVALLDGHLRMVAVQVTEATTLTGATFYQVIQGSYTADNTNGIALCTYVAGVLTVVAQTANDGNCWKGTAGSFVSVPFTTPYVAAIGTYFLYANYNSSAQTTGPTVGVFPNLFTTAVNDFTNTAKLSGLMTTQPTYPTPQNISAVTANATPMFMEVY